MEEIIIVRIVNSNKNAFTSIIQALQEKQYKIAGMTIVDLPAVNVGRIRINPLYQQVFISEDEIQLNHSEYAMLYCMAKSPGRVFTREELYTAVWNETYPYGSNTVDNTIFRLRKKIEPDPKHPVYIETVHGVGYRFLPYK